MALINQQEAAKQIRQNKDTHDTALCELVGLMLWFPIDWLEPYEEGEEK